MPPRSRVVMRVVSGLLVSCSARSLHHREDTLVAVGMGTTHVVLDAGVDLVLELLELALRQRVAREGSQALGAVELDARVMEVLAEVVAGREPRSSPSRPA
jgi:hypothetical protein